MDAWRKSEVSLGYADRRLPFAFSHRGCGLFRPPVCSRIWRNAQDYAAASGKGRSHDPPPRTASAQCERLPQRPWKQFTLPYRPIEVISADHVQAIHDTALTILEEIGMKVLSDQARAFYAQGGADIALRLRSGAVRSRHGDELDGQGACQVHSGGAQSGRNVKVGGAECHLLLRRRAGLCL